MKHVPRYIIASIIALTTVNFPAPVPGQTTLAIQGGLSRATVSGLDLPGADLDARIGLSLSASATIPLQDNFSLRLDGGYVQKGSRVESELFEGNLFLDYIELSGLGAVNLTPSGSPASVYALAGPSFGFNTKCESSGSARVSGIEGFEGFEGFEDLFSGSFSESCGDDVSGIDLGITAGIGADMPISEEMTFSLNLRYTLGLTNVDKTGDEDIKNRNLTLQVGVGFPIGE